MEWNLLQRRLPLIGKAGGCAAMEPALASSMSKGSVPFVESPIAASPNERGGRKEISEKLGKGALSELRFCSAAVMR